MGGVLIRIKKMMDGVSAQLPAWFRPWADIERAVYMESAGQGQVSDRPDDVADIMTEYEGIRVEALPQRASPELIEEMRERWTKS